MKVVKQIVRRALLVIGLLGCVQMSQAQHLQASLSHYSTDNGLASNAIAYMTQDDYGFLWIATWNGLSRFDGYHFYNYATGAGSHIPNMHNRILDLAIDTHQNVWMRMYDHRVFVLRRSVDKIVNPFENISGSAEYRSEYPIVVTSGGSVLVNVSGVGLYKFKPEADGFSSELVTTAGLQVTSMAEGYHDEIWLGTDKGVHRMDISNLTIERKGYFLDEYITCLFSNGYNVFVGTRSGKILSYAYGQEPKEIRRGGKSINKLFVDTHDIIWFTDDRQGASRLNPATGDEKLFTQRVTAPDLDGGGGVFAENNGTVWVRMNHGGYGYYNRMTDEVEYFHNDPINPWNLSNTVNASLEKNEGVIWESTSRRGLEKLEIMKKTIGRNLLYPDEGSSLGNEIRTMLYDPTRKWLLLGNKLGELYIIKSDSSRVVITKDSKGNPIGRTYGVSQDSKGNYWLCSKDNGVFRITPGTNGMDIQRFCHDDQDEWSLSSNGAYAAVEDKDGNIWVATYGGGVNLLTKNKNGKMIAIHNKNAMTTYPYNSHMKVRCVTLDKEGNVWAGTTDGILIMSYRDKKLDIRRLTPSEEEPDQMLMSNDIVCLAKDQHGDMWVGTNGGGLAHTIGRDSQGNWLFEHFGNEDGLPSEEIRSLTFDNRGNVWFATDHVLCSYDMGKRIFTTFSSLDGVDETMCSEGAAITLPNGDILFGTLCGYYKVERAKLVNTAGNILKLRITDFWLNDELQSPRLNDTYDYYVPDSRQVVLPSHSDFFSFRFASLNYQLQHRVHYQYMMEGYDHSWQNADKTLKASYSNLPTGQYRFCVKAFLLESPEKYDQKEIEIIVPPVFFLTTNAIWIYMFIVAAFALWIMFRIQRSVAKVANMRMLQGKPQSLNYMEEEDVDFMRVQNEYLEVHISDPMLTPDELVEVSGKSADAYQQLLYQITHKTPREFINDYRLKMATSMLENTDDSIAQIVFKCGYSDVSAFNRMLQSKIGMLPSQYRDQYRKKTTEKAPDTDQ